MQPHEGGALAGVWLLLGIMGVTAGCATWVRAQTGRPVRRKVLLGLALLEQMFALFVLLVEHLIVLFRGDHDLYRVTNVIFVVLLFGAFALMSGYVFLESVSRNDAA